MSLERRFATEPREAATGQPGLVQGDDGTVSVVAPNGHRSALHQTAGALLSSADLLDLHNTAIELAPSPGGGKAYLVLSALFVYHFGTVAYFGNGPGPSTVVVGPRGAVLDNWSQVNVTNAGSGAVQLNLLEQAGSCWVQINDGDGVGNTVGGANGGGPDPSLLDDQPLIVGTPTVGGYTPWMDGDGTLGVSVVYAVVDVF